MTIVTLQVVQHYPQHILIFVSLIVIIIRNAYFVIVVIVHVNGLVGFVDSKALATGTGNDFYSFRLH